MNTKLRTIVNADGFQGFLLSDNFFLSCSPLPDVCCLLFSLLCRKFPDSGRRFEHNMAPGHHFCVMTTTGQNMF